MAFKTVKGSGMTNDLTGTSFKRGNGDPGYRISTRGFTSIFSGFSEDGSHGVVVDAPVSIVIPHPRPPEPSHDTVARLCFEKKKHQPQKTNSK